MQPVQDACPQRRALLRLALAASLSACDRGAPERAASRIDAEWHRKTLVDGLLAQWLAVSPTASGMFVTRFDRQWKAVERGSVDLTAQSRLIYAMAVGHELSRDPRYLAAARKGADFLLANFHDPLHGGFFYAVNADGTPRAEHKSTYGHAFAILALATLARVDDGKDAAESRQRWQAAALSAWRDVDIGLRDAAGGLYSEASRSFVTQPGGTRTQNPSMHMFEALLALLDATGDARVRSAARKLGDFAVYRMLEGRPDGSARIPEWYDSDWKPLATSEGGGFIDLGHQFEWTHLLLGAAERGISPIYASVSERVLQYAQEKGYDEHDGGAFGRAFPDQDRIDRDKGEWQQYECLHCFITAAASAGRPELWRRYDQTLAFVRTELVDARQDSCRHVRCGEERLDPYHMTSMHLAAIRAAQA